MIALSLIDQLVSYALAIYGAVLFVAVAVGTLLKRRRIWEWISDQLDEWPERELRRRGRDA